MNNLSNMSNINNMNNMNQSKQRLYNQMKYLNSNNSLDYKSNFELTLNQNDFKIQKKNLNLKNKEIINEFNISTKEIFSKDLKRKHMSYLNYLE